MKKSIALLFAVSLLALTSIAQSDSVAKQKEITVVKSNTNEQVKNETAPKNSGAVVVKKSSAKQLQHKAVKMEKAKKKD